MAQCVSMGTKEQLEDKKTRHPACVSYGAVLSRRTATSLGEVGDHRGCTDAVGSRRQRGDRCHGSWNDPFEAPRRSDALCGQP